MPDFVSNEEIVLAARKNLIQGTWDYLVGGSESETTLRRNRQAFDKVAFRPRILVDVSKIDTSTTFLGQPMRIPAMLAPVGSLQVFTPEGGVAAATAAVEFGTQHCVSSVTEPPWEDTAAAGTKLCRRNSASAPRSTSAANAGCTRIAFSSDPNRKAPPERP